ncbi:MAG TPA: DUF2975 domain-containing protein [Candidatus Paceibacterota bacterium]|nr:DUF2975 domain-containing protein [Candidatus Paceibacterota bacterium]
MDFGSTMFLRVVIYLIGLLALGVCLIIAGTVLSGNAGMFLPVLLLMFVSALPFFYALHNGVLLLRYIEKNVAFSELSNKAIRIIKYCAFSISVLYAAGMPLIVSVAHKDDAPGVALLGLVFIFVTLIVGVFAAVLEKLLRSAIDLKEENDLTV